MADIAKKGPYTIDLYANDGSPLNITPPTIYGRGVGGAELSMMTWAERMVARGHDVRIYNNPDVPGAYNGVNYLPQDEFMPGNDRDVFIIYRSPNKHIQTATAGTKIHWSTDQFTIGDYARDIVPFVDLIVTISPYHKRDYQDRYHPDPAKIMYLDLGVRLRDYGEPVEKVPNRFIYCSVPERGLKLLGYMWPRIQQAIPDATLAVTGDHRLWGANAPHNHQYRLDMINLKGVTFLGAIERAELAKRQHEAEYHLHPCIYPELFCISSAECQVTGAISITSDAGALVTTNQWGIVVPGNPHDPTWQATYIGQIERLALDPAMRQQMTETSSQAARKRFDWRVICEDWEYAIAAALHKKTQIIKKECHQ